jgi:hypothetical protein
MIACGKSDESDDYLPIVKMLLNHPKIEINQPNKVIIIESLSWFLLVLILLIFCIVEWLDSIALCFLF